VDTKATLQDVADRAKVHRSTVSLALRDHPRISADVRQRVKQIASELGYRMNPLVAALMQSRRSGRPVRHAVLAYVTNYPTRYGWRPPHHDRPDYFPGAAARAEELGFKLEHFWLAEPGMTAERFCDILSTRGVYGVLIGRLPPGQDSMRLLWGRFSCVALGRTLRSPTLHYVTEDHFAGATLAMERILARGYRRIGFVFSEADDSPRVGDRWLGACMREALRLPVRDRLQPFYFEEGADQAAAFARWFRRWRPDAILATHAAPAIDWLEQMKLRVPDDVAVATVINDHPDRGWAGIHCDQGKLGGLAVEMLIGLMHRREVGVPDDPHEVLLAGEWRDGWTLPDRAG
jgi:DNA-binding LacI/PurR family transcriptional regulator